MTTLKNSFFIIAIALCIVPIHGMNKLKRVAYKVVGVQRCYDDLGIGIHDSITKTDIENAYEAKKKAIEAGDYVAMRELKKQYHENSRRLHPDKHARKSEAEVNNATEQFKQMKKVYDKACEDAKNKALLDAQFSKNIIELAPFIDVCVVGGAIIGTGASIIGLMKAYKWLREYRSPNTVLLEKMEQAAQTAVDLILRLEFDRYNPTAQTDSLSMQFDLDPLFAQLSDEVRNKVMQIVMSFDKTLEYTYEQCAWHYDGLTAAELASQNPRLVREMKYMLQQLLEAFQLCKKDLKLDKSWYSEFFKTYNKKQC